MKTNLSPRGDKRADTDTVGLLSILLVMTALVVFVFVADPFQTTSANTGLGLQIKQLVEQVLQSLRALVQL